MSQRKIVFFIAITGVLLWFLRSSPLSVAQTTITGTYQQISLKKMTRDQAIDLYLDKQEADHDYDWKVALSFYGKVVDENNKPVSNAKVHLIWTTLDDPSGTKEEYISSDGNGFFSLTNQRGKLLEVRVEKEGYYTVEGGNGALAFEYADPGSQVYYEPDPKNPVVFHLHKKGVGTKLFSKTLNIPLHNHLLDARVNLMQGFIRPDGVLSITFDASKFSHDPQPFPWTASLKMAEGGLVETDEQYPFNAPAGGYKSEVVMTKELTGDVLNGHAAKTYYFYLPSTNTYGRATITFDVRLGVTVEYSYNPTPGDRYLEPVSK